MITSDNQMYIKIIRGINKQAHKFSQLSLPIKLFSYLISSAIVVLIAAFALDSTFGDNFYLPSKQTTTFSALFSPAQDGGYFELFQYILLLWCSILSAIWVIGRKYFQLIYIPFIYFFLFLDDALLIHDAIAGFYINEIYQKYNLFNNDFIRVKDFAEWSYWLIVFFIILILAKSSFQNNQIEIQKFIKYNFYFFFGMAFFALFIDLINANWYRWITVEPEYLKSFVQHLIMLIEEIGEISVIASACVWLFSKNFTKINLKN